MGWKVLRHILQRLHFSANLGFVVRGFVGSKGACEDLGASLRIEHVVERWHGAIVEIGSGRPDTVQRRGLVAFWPRDLEASGLFLGKPALVVEIEVFWRQSAQTRGVRADHIVCHDLVRILAPGPYVP